jgi:hypothetical protein
VRSLLIVALLATTAAADEVDPNLPPPPIAQQLDPPLLDQPRSGPPDPASTTLPPQGPPYERMFDSRDAFDSRRNTHPFGIQLETQFTHVIGETVAALSLTLAAPFSPRFGRMRISLGSYLVDGEGGDITSEEYDPSNLRFALGWERWVFCIHRKVCPGIAADLSYAFVDPLDGTLLAPHGVIDLKTKRADGFGLRLGAGPTILMATKTSNGRERFDVGFSVYVNFVRWAAY